MSDQGQTAPKEDRGSASFPRPQDAAGFGPESANRSIEPYGTAAVARPRYGIEQGAKAPGNHDRGIEADVADGRVSREPGLPVPARSGAVPKPDAQPNGEAALDPYANARGRVTRGGTTRVPNG